MFNPITTAAAGWSEAVEERAQRLLRFPIGSSGGVPVTIEAMLADSGLDPVMSARLLMTVPPLEAVTALTRSIADCRIDGQPCPDPNGLARSALSAAGRAVALSEIHPEWVLLIGLWGAGRRLLSRMLSPGARPGC